MILFSANLNVRDFAARPRPAGGARAGRSWSRTTSGSAATASSASARAGATANILAAFVGTGIGGCLILDGKVVEGATRQRRRDRPHRRQGRRARSAAAGGGAAWRPSPAGPRSPGGSPRPSARASRPSSPPRSTRSRASSRAATWPRPSPRGDPVAVKEVHRAAHYLGLGLGGLVNVLGPEIVIIGGGVTEALGEPFLEPIRASAREQILVDPDGKIQIEPAALGDDAGILGARCSPARGSRHDSDASLGAILDRVCGPVGWVCT